MDWIKENWMPIAMAIAGFLLYNNPELLEKLKAILGGVFTTQPNQNPSNEPQTITLKTDEEDEPYDDCCAYADVCNLKDYFKSTNNDAGVKKANELGKLLFQDTEAT